MDKLQRVKFAVWYDYLCGHFDYNFACGILTELLRAKNALMKEGAK
jgi:hypothetical protein